VTGRGGRAAQKARDYRFAVASWALVAAVLTLTQTVAHRRAVSGGGQWGDAWALPWMPHEGRIAWDAGLYLRVAEHGYRLPEALEAGFPGYALAIRFLRTATGGYGTAAVLISLVSGAAAAVLCWKWFALVGLTERDRRVALWIVLLYPYSFMLFGVAYSDSLLLALVMGAFVALETRHYLVAGLVGAAATATRPTAMLLVVALLALAVQREGAVRFDTATSTASAWRRPWSSLQVRADRFRPQIALVLLSGLGIGSYMLFLARHAGDPFYFLTVQTTGYGHPSPFHPATWVKWSFWADPGNTVHHVGDVANELAATFVIAATLLSAPSIGRRFGWGYSVLGPGIAASVWLTAGWLTPAGRYLLPVIPALAALAAPTVAATRRRSVVVLTALGAGSIVLTIGFAGWFDLHW
jgi:hypothetical protein